MGSQTWKHPCLTCGACCSHFRVSFYWREADDETPNGVPLALTEDSGPFRRCMKSTTQKKPRCAALSGRVGEEVKCEIYDSRPTPCRAFEASYSNKKKNKRCDQARFAFGLKPLTPRDWDQPEKSDPDIKPAA